MDDKILIPYRNAEGNVKFLEVSTEEADTLAGIILDMRTLDEDSKNLIISIREGMENEETSLK